MTYASIIIEVLRVRPNLVFWLAALAQVLLWFLVPTLFFSAPPGKLAELLALGHEFQLGTVFGPPLAYWLADIVFTLAGGRMIAIYLLSQTCVLVTLWSLMTLGRRIVGAQQSVLAILLLVGVSVLSIPTLEFGPSVLAMPLCALSLLAAWRALGEGHRRAWLGLSTTLGLMLLTSYFAVILVALLGIFIITTRRGRAALRTSGPWLCLLIIAFIVAPFGWWISRQQMLVDSVLDAWHGVSPAATAMIWLRLIGSLIMANAGAVLLIGIASGWPFGRRRAQALSTDELKGFDRRKRIPTLNRIELKSFGAAFVLYFAIALPLIATAIAAVCLPSSRFVAAAPVLLLTGLAVIVAAGTAIPLHRQRALAYVWVALLIMPPLVLALGVTALPRLLPLQMGVAEPAKAVGRFFSETFERRTGRPLPIVAGDTRLASLVAATGASRPRLFVDATTTPWLSRRDIRTQGAVLLWPAHDTPGTPPPSIKAQFPNLILEVPRVFQRPLQGLGPSLRVGWAVIRPQATSIGKQTSQK